MKIHHVAITVNNLEESLKFYRDFFDFQIVKLFERKDMGAKSVFVKLDEFSLELWEFLDMKENSDDLKDIKVKGIRHIAFEVENIDKTVSEFRSKKLDISDPEMGASGHRYSFTNDPNGVALELYEK